MKLLSQFDADLMIGRDNQNAQVGSRTSISGENANPDEANHSTTVDGSEVNIHTFERSITGRVRSEVDNVIATVESRVDDTILTARES